MFRTMCYTACCFSYGVILECALVRITPYSTVVTWLCEHIGEKIRSREWPLGSAKDPICLSQTAGVRVTAAKNDFQMRSKFGEAGQ